MLADGIQDLVVARFLLQGLELGSHVLFTPQFCLLID
jgi:hypothetical protein